MEVNHKDYDDARRRIQEDVRAELAEAEKWGEITHEEAEGLLHRWLNRWWCEDEDLPERGGGPCLDRELYGE